MQWFCDSSIIMLLLIQMMSAFICYSLLLHSAAFFSASCLEREKHPLQELHLKLIFEGWPIFKRLQYIPCRPGDPCRPASPFSPLLPGSPSLPSRPGRPSRPSLPRGPWTVYILGVLSELPPVVLSCVDCTLLSSLGRAPARCRRRNTTRQH